MLYCLRPQDQGVEMSLVGTSHQRVDALAKARGEHLYPSDHGLPDMLWLRLVRADMPHARILRIDTSRAERLEGVERVFTARDIPFNRFGLIVADQPVL